MNYCDWCKERLYPDNPEVGYRAMGRYWPPLCHGCSHEYDKGIEAEIGRLKERINGLEMIVCLPGEVPRKYQDQLQQVRAEVTHIHKEHHERKTTKDKYKYY